jgi:proteasome accessory factor B
MTSSTTGRKTERLMNLLIMLLVQRQFVSKDRIREFLYPDASTEAFEKMFERDKEELRSLGVPIEVGNMDAYFDDEPGYRVRPDRLSLPDIALTPDEAAVIGLATRVWQHARLADATTEAVRKLTALGVEVDESALDIAEPRLSADEPSFDVFWEATQERTPVEFDYRRPGAPRATTRHLEPWGVVRYSGRWYVVGLDTDRGQERVFRLSRVEGEARRTGTPGSYDVPPGTDVRATAVRLAPPPSTGEAVVLVRRDAGIALRADAVSIETDVAGPDTRTAWDRVRISRGGQGVADELLGYGAAVYVESPAELRTEVVDRLRAVVDGVEVAS